MSSGRSRSGGMWIGRTLRRNSRSSRNWPCREAFARSLFVAAITRTSTVTGFSPPSRSITPDSSTRSNFAWASGPRSPTSSRNSVPRSASSNRRTPALAMDGGGDELLAGPRFAGDQHAHLRGCDPGDQVPQLLHRLAHADERVGVPQGFVQAPVLGQRTGQLERGPQRREQALRGQRFFEELKGTQLGRPDRVGEVRLAAHHHHRQVGRHALELLERGEAVGPARHHQIEQYGIGRVALHRRQPRAAVRRLRRLEPFRLEQRRHHLADVRLVIDEQDARAHAADSTMENVAPPPGVSATVMLPLWASIVWRTRASPRPVPSCLVVKYGSNTRWRRSSGIPAPWSAIVTASPFPSRLTAISIDPRPPMASAALRNKFANARRNGS